MEVLKSIFLLIRYSMPKKLTEWVNLSRVKSLNVKFSIYQKQSSAGVLYKSVLKLFTEFIENYQKYPWCGLYFKISG